MGERMRGFASDNYAGAHPEVIAAVSEANRDHAVSYGGDPWTARAGELLRAHFGASAQPWLVFNGTAANVLALCALCRSWEAVITPATSHLQADEAGASERMAGLKLIAVATADGKLRPGDLPGLLARAGDEHAVQPRLISIANATELGTVYTIAETCALADAAHARGLLLHVDGARLANAAVALDASLADVTALTGADVVSFGLTKNGAIGVEAVIFLSEPPVGFAWIRKQQAQLASKMRFMAAQVVALLQDDLWRRSAAQANRMAAMLAGAVRDLDGVRVTQPVQANAVFAVLDPAVAAVARERFPFYTWDEATGEVRWMCSWDTTEEDVHEFAAVLREAGQRTKGAAWTRTPSTCPSAST
jgi:threonine aldolase